MSRYVPFLPLWFPAEGNAAADSFSGLNLGLCLFWGLFMQHGAYIIGPSSINKHQRRLLYLLNCLCLCMVILTNPLACALAFLV